MSKNRGQGPFRCDDSDLCRDVVSDTFLIAWRERDRLPKDATRAWLYGTARRVVANQRRATVRRAALVDRLLDHASHQPAPEPDATDTELELRSALVRLPERDREALVLVGWCEMTNSEAAHVLGCTPVAFAVRLHRARRRLKAELSGPEDAPSVPSTFARKVTAR